MSIRHAMGSIRWGMISAVHRREFRLPDAEPTVSFTFDDFPRSALLMGGAILKGFDACGTYYTAMGLMDQINEIGQQFCAEDLSALLSDGHELGSHTFSHISCHSVSLSDFQADMNRGLQAIEQATGIRDTPSFSYPYGHATLQAKPRIGRMVSSCRGTVPGINKIPVDLNLLRANCLYSHSFNLDSIGRLIQANKKCRGWLIFYTHDVCERPSLFGCTPVELESVVKLVAECETRILSIGKALCNDTNSM